jgi:hypothetical protein
MDLALLKKAARITEDSQLVAFGKMTKRFPTHLGVKDQKLDRVWLWPFEHYEVATFDEGNGCCRVIMVESKLSNGVQTLANRLANMTAEAYGRTTKVVEILAALTDGDVEEVFSDLYQGLLQSGRLE